MKIRLVGGPFGGKVVNGSPGSVLVFRGPKKMTRKQRYEFEMKQYQDNKTNGYYSGLARTPIVEARYQVSHRAQQASNGQMFMAPCMHPDGSVFYEYIDGSKTEVPYGY